MRRILAVFLVVLGGLAASAAHASVIYFQFNPNFDTGGVRQAFIFGEANATGTVIGDAFSQVFNLGADGFAVVTIPVANELTAGVIQNRGFRIESTANLSAYMLSRRSASTDMTYLIDGSRLGTRYVTAGYFAASIALPDQISAQATQDNTTVTFRLKTGEEVAVTLNAGETYLIERAADLTGSFVESDKPIAVFSGNRCTNIPSGNTACDHIVEQMPDISALSTTHYVSRSPRTGTQGDVLRVTAAEDGTEVRIDGVLVATLSAGQYHEARVGADGNVIDTSRPVLVTQYLIGQTQAGANTDPAMTIVPGSDQWLKDYVFATPLGAANFPTDFISLIIPTAALDSLLVAGVAIDPTLFSILGATEFSFGTVDVSGTTGPFTISADLEFQLLLMGFDSFDSYFTYGGARFAPGASPDPDPDPTPVPAPGTLGLVLIGLGLLGASRIRRKA